MSLGDNIKRLRRDSGQTQGQLAKLSGIKVGHISKLERNETDPKLSTIYKLMNAFNCSADTLLMDSEKVGLDGIVKVIFERALNLPEENKRVIIDIVDKYCIAVGFQAQFKHDDKLKLMLWSGKPKDILSNKNSS